MLTVRFCLNVWLTLSPYKQRRLSALSCEIWVSCQDEVICKTSPKSLEGASHTAHSVVLHWCLLSVHSHNTLGVVSFVLCMSDWLSAAFCGGELDGDVLLGDGGEEGCGVSVLSLITSSASSSLCWTEERYFSSKLQSALSMPLPSPEKTLWTGLSALTVFRESAVPPLRKLSSCAACCSLVDWKPESGKEMSVLGGSFELDAA